MTAKPTPPEVDGRTREELLAEARDLAPYYTDAWDPDAGDVGSALLELFATMAADVVERLDGAPEKHRRRFFEELGFDRSPPQPARLPLTFGVADGVTRNVAVAAGTRAVAPATEGRPETVVEVVPDGDFEATPANLVAAYSVDPATDHLADHLGPLADGRETELFGGPSTQEHALYLGHEDLLVVDPGTVLRVDLGTDAPVATLRDGLVWEYYGEAPVGEETVEGWHPVEGLTVYRPPGRDVVEVEFSLRGEATPAVLVEVVESAAAAAETDFAAATPVAATVETRWLRCRFLPPGDAATPPTDPFDVDLRSVELVAGTSAEAFEPDEVLANDVPQAVGFGDDEDVLPFGTLPRPGDACYVGSAQAFTKPGTTVAVEFTAPAVTVDPGDATRDPTLSWEYWDGDNWARLDVETDDTTDLKTPGPVTFEVPDALEPTTVAGQEGHWVRVRLVGGAYVRPTATRKGTSPLEWETSYEGAPPRFGHVELSFPADPPGEAPEHELSYNNLAFDTDVTSPFVGPPDEEQTLYVGFDGPLSDGPIQLLPSVLDREFPPGFHPRVRWEYPTDATGETWAPLDTSDETEGLTRRGIVGLVFPAATVAHARFGRELHWVRARVDGDGFGVATTAVPGSPVAITHVDAREEYLELTNVGRETVDLSGYLVDLEYAQPDEQVAALPPGTTLAPGAYLGIHTGAPVPPDADPAFRKGADVTLGFDEPVINDYTPDTVAVLTPEGRPVAVRTDDLDGTDVPRFLAEAERETGGDPGGADDVDVDASAESHLVEPCEGEFVYRPPRVDAEPCEETLATTPPAGRPTDAPPTLAGLYLNATWGENLRTVADERLGSSDGEPSQSFAVVSPPVTDESVWVEERAALSAGAREALVEDPDTVVETETTADGETTAVWVRWTRVEEFFESGPADRHYTLDPTAGVVTFGDGTNGAIPPRGANNVRAGYRTGGGAAGNVPASAVGKLVSSLPFVDSVGNPEPGDGGADAETTGEVLDRAPKELRDRGRAVAPADYERVALSTSRKLARARCLPAMDAAGDRVPGWVTLVVVPRSALDRPVPSAELKRQVRAVMAERAPATLVPPPTPGSGSAGEGSIEAGTPPPELVVRGPSYVEASVTAELVATAGATVSALEERAEEEIEAYLHPLTGGDDGTGWPFGVLPCRSDLYALLEGVEGVDHVASLDLTFAGSEGTVTVEADDRRPQVARDVLVHSGTHRTTATGGV